MHDSLRTILPVAALTLIAACGPLVDGPDPQPAPPAEATAPDTVTQAPQGRLTFDRRRMLVPGREDTLRVRAHEARLPDDLEWRSTVPGVAEIEVIASDRAVIRGLAEGRIQIVAYSRSQPSLRATHDLWVGPPIPYPPIPPADTVIDGIRYSASLETEPADEPAGATRVHVDISLTNLSPAPRTLHPDGCPVRLTGHMTGSHWDQLVHVQPPMWDTGALDIECRADPPGAITLASGETHTIRTWVYAHEVLRDRVDTRTNNVHAHLPLREGEVTLHAGSPTLRFGIARWEGSADLWIENDTLHAQATLVNELDVPVRIEHGACAVRVHAYRDAARSGEPVWRSERRKSWDFGHSMVCPAIGRTARVGPGEAYAPRDFLERIALLDMLGDSLPDGRYHFDLLVYAGEEDNTPLDAYIRVPAGSLEVAAERPPLPQERAVDGFRYRGSLEVPGGPAGTLVAEIRPMVQGGALRRYLRDCPVQLHAYRTREARDAAPRSGPPIWSEPAECGEELEEFLFGRGRGTSFEVRASAREILGDARPAGRYWFAASVHSQHYTVWLSLGEAELAR